MNKIGSSETIRKTTFNFYPYKRNLVKHKNKIDQDFLEWFVGFTEGDGTFIVSKDRLFFIINQKEERILYHIRTSLGFGSVSTYKTYSRFVVADRENVDRLISIFNGNLVLNKTNARFLSWLQARNRYRTEEIEHLNRNELVSCADNAWLSGFIDAEGCFNAARINDVRYTLGFRVRLRFIIDQKDSSVGTIGDERSVLLLVKDFLQSGVISRRKPVEGMYRFTSTSIFSHELLVQYLSRYRLRTLKRVSFLRFSSLLRYIKNRDSLPWRGKVLQRVENLIRNIEKM